MASTFKEWEAFLNPEVVRTKLISAGLFLVAHEMLLDSVKRRPLGFFANRWTSGGPDPSQEYTKEVLDRDPKGKRDAFRGSVAWLRMMDALSADDEANIRTVKDARNKIAHEMTHMLGAAVMPDFAEHFALLMRLVDKIETWWIINVDISTDPDFDDQNIVEKEVISGPSWMMHILAEVALSKDDEAWQFYRQFTELWQERTEKGQET
jgi:hypothetical protein